jgi:hypothetical protein
LKYEGEDGVWFPREMASRILADVKTNELLRLEVGELKLQLDTRMERIDSLKEALYQANLAEERAVDALDSAFTERDEAKAELRKWYRHPALWISVGIVGTVLLELVAVKTFQAVSD